jgi:hypothetical protein
LNFTGASEAALVKTSYLFPHPRSLSLREREDKPFSLRNKGTLEAQQKGGDEGRHFVVNYKNITIEPMDFPLDFKFWIPACAGMTGY